MDMDIEELRDLVQKNLALSQETNKMVRSLHRSSRWNTFFKMIWWAVVLTAGGATYLFYIQPYMVQLEKVYGQVQEGGKQLQTLQVQAQDIIKNLLPKTQ